MKTSILICATCLVVTGCSAQLRFPSLSSALSSLTGFGGAGSSNSNSGSSSNSQSGQSSPYSGLVRDYGRNLMMAMSSIYPTWVWIDFRTKINNSHNVIFTRVDIIRAIYLTSIPAQLSRSYQLQTIQTTSSSASATITATSLTIAIRSI